MDLETVAVTGGTGRIGSTIVEHLRDHGYTVASLSRSGGSDVADYDRRASALDAGALTATLADVGADAVVHLGAISEPGHDPGHRVFESNVQSAYVVLESAAALGVDSVALASSLSALGGGFEPKPARIDYLPVDESHRATPSNPYGLGKLLVEETGAGFARREDAPRTITSLRFPWMPSDEEMRTEFVEVDRSLDGVRETDDFHTARNTLFAYLVREDAAELVRLAVESDVVGHEVFWAAAADTTTTTDSATVAAEVYPDAEVETPLAGHESLISTAKARRVLGWEPERSWRDLRE